MTYNYLEAMKEDIKEYIQENYTNEELKAALQDREELENNLFDYLWIDDSVTGNASGSYTFNCWKAKEYVTANMELLKNALDDFCIESRTIAEKFINEEWEYFDVSIRCHLLSAIISNVLDEMEGQQ